MSRSAIFPPFMSSRYCEHDLQYLALCDESNVELILIGRDALNCDYFNCVLNVHQFMDLDRQIQEDGTELERGMTYEPLVGEMCMVKVNEKWYRSKFLGTGFNGSSQVYFIDYGVVCLVQRQNIRVSEKREISKRHKYFSIDFHSFIFLSHREYGIVPHVFR